MPDRAPGQALDAVRANTEPSRGSKKAAPPDFQGAEPGKLTLEMFFDATDTMDDSVVKAVKSLFAACALETATQEAETGTGQSRPRPDDGRGAVPVSAPQSRQGDTPGSRTSTAG